MMLAFRVLFPTIDPYKNVRVPRDLTPRFFLTELDDKSWLRFLFSSDHFSTLKQTHADYVSAIQRANSADLLSVLAAEVLKLSFIRQLKTDRLMAFARTLIVTAVLFIIFIVTTSQITVDAAKH